MDYLNLLIKSHIYLVLIILFIYIVELLTGFRIIIKWFTYKKAKMTAEGTALRESTLYFFYTLSFGIYYRFFSNPNESNINLLIWFITSFSLALFLWYFYRKYQGVDPSKGDYEFVRKE